MLGGTLAGGWLAENRGVVALGLTGWFVVALVWGLRLLGQSAVAAPPCAD